MSESFSLRSVLVAAGIVPGTDPGSSAAERAAAWARVVETAAAEVGSASVTPERWSEAERSTLVDAVDRTARVLEAAKAPVLVAQERAGMWRRPGVRSFEAFRASKNREDLSSARREAEAARTLTALDGGVDALARGEITPSHAQRLRAVADKVDPAARAELLTGEGAAMVRDLAKEHDPKRFARKVEELAARRHPAEVQDAHEAIRARRFLRLRPGPDGTRIEGLLDPVAGHRVQLAIEAASPRPGEDDTRTLGQRNADALDTIAGSVLAEGELSPSRHVPTQVMITMTEQSFLAAQAHLATATHSAHDADDKSLADTPRFPAIRAQDGPLLPPADLGRLLCGSAVGRLVVDAESVPLNVGRSQRTFKSHQRRAVELRDQHCAWPGCAQVARYCEVHHLDHWVEDHGETDVNRGILVCSFHHHELHRHDLDLVPTSARRTEVGAEESGSRASSASGEPPGGEPPPVADRVGESGSRSPRLSGEPPGGEPSVAARVGESGSRSPRLSGEPPGEEPPPVEDPEDAPTPRPLPGDSDYEAPTYELVPRAQTAVERRTRRHARLPRGAGHKAAARRQALPGRPERTARGGDNSRGAARRRGVDGHEALRP